MKKLVFIFALLSVALISMAQTTTVVNSSYKAFAGAASDTITTGVTKTYILDLSQTSFPYKGAVLDYSIQIFGDHISGTDEWACKVWESLDGTSWPATAVDSVTSLKSAADHVYMTTQVSKTARFIKVSVIGASATQKFKVYGHLNIGKHY